MSAETLNCPMCGAAAATEATHCSYCDSRLATIACPSCFGMMFMGSRHCPHCGAKGERARTADTVSTRRCPRCRVPLEQVALGAAMLLECPQCDGLWVDAAAFEQICADREQQSAVLGAASPVPARAAGGNERDGGGGTVRYVPCPECGQLMNRLNFARCSGVIVDLCKGHGTWFDREELRQIVEFIRAGGLEASRAKEREQLTEERRRLQQDQFAANAGADLMSEITEHEHRRAGVLLVARDLLGLLID